MKTFTIENETHNITIHTSVKEAEAVPNSERFGNEAALAKIAADWPAARLVEIWNSLPGETPVKKFRDRTTAVSRIWKAIQSLGQDGPAAEDPAPVPEVAPVAELSETAPVPEQEASETAKPEAAILESTEPAVSTAVTPHALDGGPQETPANKNATRAKKAPVAAPNAGAPREGSKTSQVIAMLKREGGTTLEEIVTAMGWQKHTTRAMLSAGGSLTKNHGLVITSEKVGDKRIFSIKA
ncbi:MAG: DUF3489 domain-containing protein [Bryobacteraceae bacterium]|jgi:hypothetical protein